MSDFVMSVSERVSFMERVVLKRDPLMAFGPFGSSAKAEEFAKRIGGAVVELEPRPPFEIIGIPDGCDHLFAIWFNDNWEQPYGEWPFLDLAQAESYCCELGFGVAIPV